MKVHVIMDVSALFYASFHANSKEREDILLAMVNKNFMDTINKNAREHKSDEIVLAFDGKSNWRKSYTRKAAHKGNESCLTVKKYKGTRRQKLTDAERAKLEKFDGFVNEFRIMLQEYTGLLVLQHDRLEADDLIAGYIQRFEGDKHVIISGDRDYLQLQRFKNVTQYDPVRSKWLTLAEYDFDPDYFMFHKCIRGDQGDNVMSAYPRIYETKIKAAYEDDYACVNVFKHKFDIEYLDERNGEVLKKSLVTEQVFEENEMLMDLTKQPEVIRELIAESIDNAFNTRGKYSMVHFLRYCGKMDFQHLIHNIGNYNKLLMGPPRNTGFD